MNLQDSNDHRCHLSDEGIPTIQLGCGGVVISELITDSGESAGVTFSLGGGEVGDMHPEIEGKRNDDPDHPFFFQIISTKPESIQVLIDRLRDAKFRLAYQNCKRTD